MTERERFTELVDIITDWVVEQANDICATCSDNVPERDINYSYCPEADYDLFLCPHQQHDLAISVQEAAQKVIDALPLPPIEEFFHRSEYYD